MCAFLLQDGTSWDMGLVYYGTWDWCIMKFAQQVYFMRLFDKTQACLHMLPMDTDGAQIPYSSFLFDCYSEKLGGNRYSCRLQNAIM